MYVCMSLHVRAWHICIVILAFVCTRLVYMTSDLTIQMAVAIVLLTIRYIGSSSVLFLAHTLALYCLQAMCSNHQRYVHTFVPFLYIVLRTVTCLLLFLLVLPIHFDLNVLY